jgi:hypothetical protein
LSVLVANHGADAHGLAEIIDGFVDEADDAWAGLAIADVGTG